MKKKILIIASFANSLPHFRGDFIQALIKEGYVVFAAAPEISTEVSNKLASLGAQPISFKLQRAGMNPFKDFDSILELKKIIKNYEIDLVFPYTIKPVVYGSIAANLAKVPVISLITGLGFTFSGASAKANILQIITKALYRFALRTNECVILQNKDDLNLFFDKKILKKNQKTAIVDGSGVNLDKYPFTEKIVKNSNVKFVIVARLIKEKGIQLFMDAALALKPNFPLAEFHVIGGKDNTPSAIKIEKLEELHNSKTIVFHGLRNDVADFLQKMHVFVLPSFYREGVPRSGIEGCSSGCAIITTDMPGCKETVIDDKNGFLIPPNDLESLIDACRYFLENPHQIKYMSIESRKLAESKFDVNIINKKLISHINSALNI